MAVSSTKDHDTSLALAWVVMLLKDVADLAKEGSKEFRDLLVMQQLQVSILTSVTFQFTFYNLFSTLTLSCLCSTEPLESCCYLRTDERAICCDQEVQEEDKLSIETGQAGLRGY